MGRSPNVFLQVIEQAIEHTRESITISDPRLPDMPLVYANPAFYHMTGYSAQESIGYNCRFLQGPDTDPQAIETIRRTLKAGDDCVVELLNYRKDGTPFWNRLSIVPLFDEAGKVTHFVGFQSDLTAERAAAKAKAQLAAMRATMQTVNDSVRNFMNNVEYFRLHLEESPDADPEMLALYDGAVESTLAVLDALSGAHTYYEREVLDGIVGIDVERSRQASDVRRERNDAENEGSGINP